MSLPPAEPGVFGADDLAGLIWFYDMHGYATLRGVLSPADVDAIELECVAAQRGVIAGELDARYGSTVFLDEAAKTDKFANYVEFISELSPAVDAAITHPAVRDAMTQILGPGCWLRAHEQNGVVYLDARPGRESGYTRIGWHSDWQASPSLDV